MGLERLSNSLPAYREMPGVSMAVDYLPWQMAVLPMDGI
jgi:hypothetical protein